jgi:hypothetical protein
MTAASSVFNRVCRSSISGGFSGRSETSRAADARSEPSELVLPPCPSQIHNGEGGLSRNILGPSTSGFLTVSINLALIGAICRALQLSETGAIGHLVQLLLKREAHASVAEAHSRQ